MIFEYKGNPYGINEYVQRLIEHIPFCMFENDLIKDIKTTLLMSSFPITYCVIGSNGIKREEHNQFEYVVFAQDRTIVPVFTIRSRAFDNELIIIVSVQGNTYDLYMSSQRITHSMYRINHGFEQFLKDYTEMLDTMKSVLGK